MKRTPLYKQTLRDAILQTLRKRPATIDGIVTRCFKHADVAKLEPFDRGTTVQNMLSVLVKEGSVSCTDGTFFSRGPAVAFGSLDYTFADATGIKKRSAAKGRHV